MESTLFISDVHINSTVALCNPSLVLDEGAKIQPSQAQEKLFRVWEQMLDQVEKKKAPKHWTVLNGDMVEGDEKGRSFQIFTRNRSTIVKWAAELLNPLAEMSAGLFFTRGTDAHTGKSSELENLLADQFTNTIKDPSTGASTWWWLPFESENVKMDIAHHPSTGVSSQIHLKYSGIDRLAWQNMLMYAEMGLEPPDLLIRSHYHLFRDSEKRFRTRAIVTPGWSLLTEYSFRKGGTELNLGQNGMVLVHTSAGKMEVEPLLTTSKPRPFISSKNIKVSND